VAEKCYCAVKDGKAYVGTKLEIAHQIAHFWVDSDRFLYTHFEGYDENIHHYYDRIEYNNEEMEKDIGNFVFYALAQNYGFQIFQDFSG